MKVHFMGIGGSGLAPIAILAKKMGYEVSGCDISKNTAYANSLKENGIEIIEGHDEKHVEDADIVAITPALFDYNPDHKEILAAKEKGILMTWQEFSGQYLQKGKDVIAIAGTHGKSTTTSLAGELLEDAGIDPIVEAGTIIKKWGAGYRYGQSNYFVIEADEFNNNYLNYHPLIAIINNLEMDHPEFFKDLDAVLDSFRNFIKNIRDNGYLIVNYDSENAKKLAEEMKEYLNEHNIQLITYSLSQKETTYQYHLSQSYPDHTDFIVNGEKISVALIGEHNVQNAMSVYALGKVLGLDNSMITKGFMNFTGIGRRLELKGVFNGISIYDDYAHHPSAVAAVIKTLKETFPDKKVLAIFEPHQISRLRMFLDEFTDGFALADEFIMTKTFEGREAHKHLKPVDFSEVQKHCSKKIYYIEDFDEIVSFVASGELSFDIIVVFGAGYSYQLTNKLVEYYESKIK
jgi:UDP-N-acetylmuramate--alanine ligase